MLLVSKTEIRKNLNELLQYEDEICIDLETTGLWAWRGDEILSVSFYLAHAKKAFTVIVREGDTLFSAPASKLEWIDWEEVNKCRIIMHNAKFDMSFLEAAGVRIDEHRVFDTMHGIFLMHNLAQSKALKTLTADLESNSPEWLQYAPEGLDLDLARETASHRADLTGVGLDALIAYAETDVVLTYILWVRERKENSELAETRACPPLAFMGREMILNRVVIDMEKRGIFWDQDVYWRMKSEMESEIMRMRQELGFDATNDNAMRAHFGMQVVDKETLRREFGKDPEVEAAIALRELRHDYGTFLIEVAKQVSDDGYLHGNFRQNGTNTGRFSSSKPNMLGIPKRMRAQFRAPDGMEYVSCDLNQIELAMCAWYSQCGPLLEVLGRGGDVHQTTADLVGVERSIGKRLNFSIVYGIGAATMSERLNCTEAEARNLIARLRRAYPELVAYKARCESTARRKGELKLYNGANREVPEVHKAWSYLIQSAVGELAKDIMIDLWLYMKEIGGHLVLHVHDEFVCEIPADSGPEVKEEIRRIITSAGPEGMMYTTDMEPWKKG